MRGPRLVVVDDVSEYRRVARSMIRKQDRVLEIGCGSGKTLEAVARLCEKAVGIDKSASEVERARERLAKAGNVLVELLDAWRVGDVIRLVRGFMGGVDVLMIDIGGVENPGAVVHMLWRYLHVFRPRLVIVKNRPLRQIIEMAIG
ncbi:hypothetical protein B6U99_01675 [Candidatus Geothermarchaeota archaeon ex4572_27]|nr:MAG: hypothetical protein B6U99_01675 [Candidatus Geothermarchaeota archaeon ex4572_27]